MSNTNCQAGDTTGFPLLLSQTLYSKWPATANVERELKKLTVPTDFTVEWGPSTQSAQISVRNTTAKDDVPGVFQISGISTVTDMTTLTFGNARYSCSGVLSIVQNQHPTFSKEGNAQYEVILAFQITNKQLNPSSPDIILLCRPIIFSTWNSSPFWPVVDAASATGKTQTAAVDLSTMFGFSSSVLMPMVAYQTCLPVKLLNYNSQPYSYGSLRIRVNVVAQPIYMVASEKGLGKCSSIRKYTLITNGTGPISIFNGVSSNSVLQFRDGFGKDLFPVKNTTRLVPSPATETLSSFSDVLNKIEILVPEEFLGKSLSEIASATKVEPAKPKKRAFKCYTVDPEKDIKGDQIMIDPTTGQRLKDILEKDIVNPDGTPITPTISYVLYGKGISDEIPVKKILSVPKGGNIPDDTYYMFLADDTNDTENGNIKGVIAKKTDLDSSDTKISSSPNIINAFSFSGDIAKINKFDDVNTRVRDGNFLLRSFSIKVASLSLIDLSSSGILPGDVEAIVILICIVIGSICLFSYSGYIIHMWFYQENGFRNSAMHVGIFILLLIGLTLFGIFAGKPSLESSS